MKIYIFALFLLVIYIGYIFTEETEYEYNNGNGTIIEQKTENGRQIITRKHEYELELYSINPEQGYRANGTDILLILDQPQLNSNVVFEIPIYPIITRINMLLFKYEKDLITDKQNSWLYVETDEGKTGWLYLGIDFDPYANGSWAILEKIITENKIWTVRKLDGSLSVWRTLNVRDRPGVNDTEVLFQLIFNNKQLGVTILAITEEEDTIDGITDYWVKIKDEQNRTGWIFGGYASVERGGPKYRIPNSEIRFQYFFP
jgi:hypothetical protein